MEEEDVVTVSSATENSNNESNKAWIIPSKVDIKIQEEVDDEDEDGLVDDDDCSLLPEILPIPRLEEDIEFDDDDDDMSIMTNDTGMGSLLSNRSRSLSSRSMMTMSRKEKMDPEILELQRKINATKQALRDAKRTTKRIQRSHKQELAPLKQSKNAGLRQLWYQQQQNRRGFGNLSEYKQQMKHVSLPCHDISDRTLAKEGKLLRSIHNKSIADHQLQIIKKNTQNTIDHIYSIVIPDIQEENEMAMASRKNQLCHVATTRSELIELYEKNVSLQRKIIAKLQLRDMEYQVKNKNNNDNNLSTKEQVDKEDGIETKEKEAVPAKGGEEAGNSANGQVIETQEDIQTSGAATKSNETTQLKLPEPTTRISDRLEKYRQVGLERQQRRVNRRRSLNMLDQEFKKTVENIEAIEKESIKRINDHMQSISISSGLTASITTNESSHDEGPEGLMMDSFSTSSTFNGYDSFECIIESSSSINATINDRNSWKQSQAALDLTCDLQDDEEEDNDDDYLTKGILPSSSSCEDKLRQMLD